MRRPPRILLALAIAFAATACGAPAASAQNKPPATTRAADPTPADASTLKKLRTFKARLLANPPADPEILADLTALSQTIPDDQLPAVARFAATDDGKDIAWPLARLLVDRHRIDAAADVIVTALTPTPDNRDYATWKWWEYNFRQREDYKQLSDEFFEALMNQFAKGPEERKLVICDVFRRDKANAKLPADQFRKQLLNRPTGNR